MVCAIVVMEKRATIDEALSCGGRGNFFSTWRGDRSVIGMPADGCAVNRRHVPVGSPAKNCDRERLAPSS